jgi:DNA-directed RNA polymerase beta' subunit
LIGCVDAFVFAVFMVRAVVAAAVVAVRACAADGGCLLQTVAVCDRRWLCALLGQGVLVCGVLTKKVLGASLMGLIHVIMNDVGPEGARSFVDQIQRIVNHWLAGRGFSVGVADTLVDQGALDRVAQAVRAAKDQVTTALSHAVAGTLVKQPGHTMVECFEQVANAVLNGARDEVRECGLWG